MSYAQAGPSGAHVPRVFSKLVKVMGTDRKKLTSLKDVIANLFSHGTLPFNAEDARIWKVWDEAVGPAISKNAQPSWIKNGRLRVTVWDPIWLQELKFVEENVREQLNKRLGRKAVEKIEFRVGPKWKSFPDQRWGG
ncbi:MAG: DUF721 domain-containing protein [Thermodesulfobacteriota bacterium]|nr:DUF721 domain-containing protein [Thermodesulfobacteriota bacterium]